MHGPSLACRLHGALVFLRLPRPCPPLSCDSFSAHPKGLSPRSCFFLCFPHSLDYLTHSRGSNHHLPRGTHLRTYPCSLTLSPAPCTTHLTASWPSSPSCSTDQPPRHNMSKTEVLMPPPAHSTARPPSQWPAPPSSCPVSLDSSLSPPYLLWVELCSPKRVEILSPGTCEHDVNWKKCLCRNN